MVDEEEGTAGFTIGAVVALRADPSRTGPIIAELDLVGERRRFRVYHSADQIRDYSEDQLLPLQPVVVEEWAETLLKQRFVDPLEFRARLTATRLSNPQVDHIYALTAARIQFIPHQFKPLLRLLRADRPRLLIADDVGVGKTIEAGLVLKELSTRQRLDRVLVLCPKALTTKWRAEMRRFDENFRVLSSESLRYCLDEVHDGAEWPEEYGRAIVHYELFRMESYLHGDQVRGRRRLGLVELSPQFDLVIADEAHHLRTPGSNSHRLIEHLCQTSEAVLMLSATPVQVHSDNLFALLHLLRPDLFPDRGTFREVLAPNRHLTRAIALLRNGPSADEHWREEAACAVTEAGESLWGRMAMKADPRYREVLQCLGDPGLGDEGRVRCIRDLEELHSLAHIMNRTRRRDIQRFTIREPRTVQVAFTAAQQAAYEAVLAFRREVLLQRYDPQVVRLILDVLERQAASCINALRDTLGRILASGGVSGAALTDDPGAEDALVGLPQSVLSHARRLHTAVAALSEDDPKFERLQQIISQTIADPGSPGKALVFSSFLNTIDYLRHRLAAAGIRIGVVTGQVPDAEREELRARFRRHRDDPEAIDVLLSSEVGCEGLDYEFCDRLVNYDIPWNPMRIEQRIGRIDRFGQTSDKVLIFNFITSGTVEERVFFRCFDRLGVFRDSIGDLEEVLGEAVQDLNRLALDPSLSPEQAEARARQIADNAIRLAEEQRRLDNESGQLLGLDDAFTAEVEDVREGGRFIDEADMGVLVDTFLRQPFLRARLDPTDDAAVQRLHVSESGRTELMSRIRRLESGWQAAASFLRALGEGQDVHLTLHQATAVERRDIEFLTPVHPLARAAADHWTQEETPLVGALRVRTDQARAGLYVFACEIWETIAARPDLKLVSIVASVVDQRFSDELSRDFLELLTDAVGSTSTAPPEASVSACVRELDAVADSRRRAEIRLLASSNDQLVNRRLASLDSFYFELIQNAEDAGAAELTFELFSDRLEVRHDGRQFTEEDVRGICGVGKSTKKEDLTQIGKFGIGFKSVYAYTRTPRVHCGDEHFRIENYVRPFAEESVAVSPGETVFVFPFDREELVADAAVNEIAKALDNLDLGTLLFLRKIERLNICGQVTRQSSLGRGVNSRSATSRRVTLTSSSSGKSQEDQWIVWERKVCGSEHTEHRVEVAVQVADRKGKEQFVACESSPLVVFFPTKNETFLGFLIQGPYRTTPARDNIPEFDPWNKLLVRETAALVVDVLNDLRDAGLLSVDVLQMLPIASSRFKSDSMFRPLFSAVRDAFLREKLIPLFCGGYGTAEEVKLARGTGLRELLSPDQLGALYGLSMPVAFAQESITENRTPNLWHYLREELEISEVTPDAVVGRSTRNFLATQSDEWLTRFYGFLSLNSSLWKQNWYERQPKPVHARPIIRLEDGSHVKPFAAKDKPNAYLPGPNATRFPTVRRAVADAPAARQFLEALGLTTPDAVAEILEHVLPRYERISPDELDWTQHEADLELISQALSSTSGERRSQLHKQLQKSDLIIGENSATNERSLRTPISLYLATSDLECYFEGNPNAWFAAERYEPWLSLLKELGVREKVWINAGKADSQGHVVIVRDHGHHERGLEGFDANARMDGLKHALSHPTAARSEYVWNTLLAPNKRLIAGTVECATRQEYIGSHFEKRMSPIGDIATGECWIRDVDGIFRSPRELGLDDLPESYKRDDALAKALGMIQPVIEDASRELGIPSELLRALQDNPDLLEKLERDVRARNKAATFDRDTSAAPGDGPRHRSYADDLSNAFQHPATVTKNEGDGPALGRVRNPELRRERVQESIKEDRNSEPAAQERFRRVERRVWETRDSTVKHFLLEQYSGHCQICDDVFDKYDGTPYFEGLYLVSRLRGRWLNRPGNMLCLCATCCAKLQYGPLDGADVIDQIMDWRTAKEGGGPAAFSLILCGKLVQLRFTEKHLLELQEIMKSETEPSAQ